MAPAPVTSPTASLLENTISQCAFWQVNKAIAKALGSIEAAALLADLIAKRKYFRERGQLDSEGGFFNTAEYIEDTLVLTKERRQKWTNLLTRLGLIRVAKRGMPSRNYYYINDDAVTALLSQSTENPTHLSTGKAAQKSAGKAATNKNRVLNKKKQEPVPEPVFGLDQHREGVVREQSPRCKTQTEVEARSKAEIKECEQVINCPGVPESTKLYVTAKLLLPLKQMLDAGKPNGLSPAKRAALDRIKSNLTNQQRRDLQDDDLEEHKAQDELTALMIQLKSADPSTLKTAFQDQYGEGRLGLLTRKWSFEDIVAFQRQTKSVQDALNPTQ
jgi:hypothetical protein